MASALDTERAAIEARFAANAAGTIAWPNTKADPPDDAAWWRPRILWGDGDLITKNGLNHIVGVFSIDRFVPADGRGLGAAYDDLDAIRDAFNRVQVSNTKFGVASGPRIVPRVDALASEGEPDLEWRQLNVSVPFRIDDTNA